MFTESKYHIKIENQILEIDHPSSNGSEFFDICDVSGKIHLTGKLSKSGNTTKACLNSIQKGSYQLFIVNQGTVIQENLEFN